jgi:hypothetical protein
VKAAAVCETFQLGVAVHSSGELGIQLATMLHLGAVLPNLTFSAGRALHHLLDDVIVGGKLKYECGSIAVPTAPGLGVKLDRAKLEQYHELFKEARHVPIRSRSAASRLDAARSQHAMADPLTAARRASRRDRSTLRRAVVLRSHCSLVPTVSRGEDGYDLWLRYPRSTIRRCSREYRGASARSSSPETRRRCARRARSSSRAHGSARARPPCGA